MIYIWEDAGTRVEARRTRLMVIAKEREEKQGERGEEGGEGRGEETQRVRAGLGF